MNKKFLSGRFPLGIGFIGLSFVVALAAKIVFFLYFTDPIYRNGSVVIYIGSWMLGLLGIWLVGREYYETIEKYTTLKFYHESVVEGTKKVAEALKKK